MWLLVNDDLAVRLEAVDVVTSNGLWVDLYELDGTILVTVNAGDSIRLIDTDQMVAKLIRPVAEMHPCPRCGALLTHDEAICADCRAEAIKEMTDHQDEVEQKRRPL